MAAALLSALRGLHEDYVFDSQEDSARGAEYLVEALLMGLLRQPEPDIALPDPRIAEES